MRHGSTEASIGTNVQSPIHCSKGILSGTVFSTQMCSLPDDTDDDDDSMLIIVHFQSLYCGLCLIRGLTSGRHTLAATWRHRGWCWRWWCRLYLDTESNSLSSSRSLRQPSIWYFLPSPQSSAGRREREERGNCRPGLQDTRRLMGLSPPPPNLGWLGTLVSSLRSSVSASACSFCLFASHSVWIITLSQCSGCSEKISYDDIELSQILINLLRIVCLISHYLVTSVGWTPARLTVTEGPDCPPWAGPRTRWSPCCSETGARCSPPSGWGQAGSGPPSSASSASSSGFETRFSPEKPQGLAKISWTNFMLTCFSVTVSGVFLEISTWVSFSWSAAAISIRLARVRYLLKWNSFSSSVNCLVEKFVRPVLLMPPPPPWPP